MSLGMDDEATLGDVAEYCEHGIDRFTMCQKCRKVAFVRQSSALKTVGDLLNQSAFKRDRTYPNATITSAKKGTYRLRLVRPDETGLLHELYGLISGEFKGSEVESFEDFVSGVSGICLTGEAYKTYYRIAIAENDVEEVIALYVWSLVAMLDAPGQSVLVGAYALTQEEYGGRGIIRELFITALMQAAIDATVIGTSLVAVAGDCTERSQPAWDRMGRSRIFLRESDGVHHELPFFQPPQRFDPTGEESEGARAVPEHFMVLLMEEQLSAEMILSLVRAAYRWSARKPSGYFKGDYEHSLYEGRFEELLGDLEAFLSRQGELLFLTLERQGQIRREICDDAVRTHGTAWG